MSHRDVFVRTVLFGFTGPWSACRYVLFGTDIPYDIESEGVSIMETIKGIEGMNLSEATKKKIYEDNARRLLCL
jgi:predicted TIM-barrel fold metal-dependent hydrolase